MKACFILLLFWQSMIVPFSVSNLQPSFFQNDEVIETRTKTMNFPLNYQLQKDQLKLTKKQLLLQDTKAKQHQLTNNLIPKHKPLFLEISEQLFNELSWLKTNQTINYYLTYQSHFSWIDTAKNEYSSITNFVLEYDERLADQTKYDLEDEKIFFDSLATWNGSRLLGVHLKNHQIELVRDDKKFYLSIEINAGISLETIFATFKESDDKTFAWQFELILQRVEINLHYQEFNPQLMHILSTTEFTNDLSEQNLQLIKEKYLYFLKTKYFIWLEEKYFWINFNFKKFYQDFNFHNFNPDLTVNEFHFFLETTDQLNQKNKLKLRFILIHQQSFAWTDELDYEIKPDAFDDFLWSLKNKILQQGYDLTWFNFIVEPKQIIISSVNQNIYRFNPITLTYKFLVEESLDENPELVPNPDLPKNDLKESRKKFNYHYFYLLLIPFFFLILYLTIIFINKLKHRKRKMIK